MAAKVRQLTSTATLIRVSGEVDGFTAPELGRAIEERFTRGDRRLVIDLQDVDFLGTGGLAVLLEARANALRMKRKLVLVCPNRIARRPLELAGLLEMFTTAASVEEALGR
jgi:anti-sigma B factor antagonist